MKEISMTRNQGSSMQNGGNLGHSKFQENGPEKTTQNLGIKDGKLRRQT
jgi:hypothetical protein